MSLNSWHRLLHLPRTAEGYYSLLGLEFQFGKERVSCRMIVLQYGCTLRHCMLKNEHSRPDTIHTPLNQAVGRQEGHDLESRLRHIEVQGLSDLASEEKRKQTKN